MKDRQGTPDDYQGAKPRLWDGQERRRWDRGLLTDAEIRQNLVDALQGMRVRHRELWLAANAIKATTQVLELPPNRQELDRLFNALENEPKVLLQH